MSGVDRLEIGDLYYNDGTRTVVSLTLNPDFDLQALLQWFDAFPSANLLFPDSVRRLELVDLHQNLRSARA